MASEEEEIRAELADEGITEDRTPPEVPPAKPEVPPATPPSIDDGDVVDASNEPEEPEKEEEKAAATSPAEDPRDAALRELRTEIQAQRSKLAEMERGGFRHAPQATDRDAEILARDPNTFETVGELNEYWQAYHRRSLRESEQRAQVAGRIASSEQHARGLLSVESVGAGYDFDSLTVKHVTPLEEENPVIAELMQRLPGDPAMNRYTLALVREIQSLSPDPTKAVKMIRQALSGTKQGEKNVLAKIGEASRRQADRIRSGGGGAVTPKTKLRAGEDVWDMDEAAFARLEGRHS